MRRNLIAGLMACTLVGISTPAYAQVREYLNSPAAAAESAESRALVEDIALQIEALNSAEPARYCGTGLVDHIRRHSDQLSPGARSALAAAIPGAEARPTLANEEIYDHPTAPIRIHFTRTGADSVRNASSDTAADGIPIYVHVTADAMARGLELLTDSLGFAPPLTDGSEGGGTDLYDVYLAIPGFFFAIAFTAVDTTTLQWRIFNGVDSVLVGSAFQVVHPTMEPFPQVADPLDLLRITCVHEFFHSIHFSLDVLEKPNTQRNNWWQEGNSTWFEDYAYPDINDWTNIGPYMDRPWESMITSTNSASLHPYGGGSMWVFYLVERYGTTDIIKQIWDQCGRIPGDNTLAAHADSLAPYGVTLEAAWLEFTEWCMRTGTHWDATSFNQGAAWPEPERIRTYFDYPQAALATDGLDTLASLIDSTVPVDTLGTSLPSVSLQGMAFLPIAYIPFPTVSDSMVFFASGTTEHPVNFMYGGTNRGVFPNRVEFNPLAEGSNTTLPDWLDYDPLLAVATSGINLDTQVTGAGTSPYDSALVPEPETPLLIAALDTKVASDETVVINSPYPNPVNVALGQAAEFEITALEPKTIRIEVFALSGDLVRSIVLENALSTVSVFWDGKNDSGQPVASGLYLCRLKVGSVEEVYRVGIVR